MQGHSCVTLINRAFVPASNPYTFVVAALLIAVSLVAVNGMSRSCTCLTRRRSLVTSCTSMAALISAARFAGRTGSHPGNAGLIQPATSEHANRNGSQPAGGERHQQRAKRRRIGPYAVRIVARAEFRI